LPWLHHVTLQHRLNPFSSAGVEMAAVNKGLHRSDSDWLAVVGIILLYLALLAITALAVLNTSPFLQYYNWK